MKRFVSTLVALVLILTVFATPAQAIPNKFKGCPLIKKDGITYMLYKRCAIVRKTPNRETVTIPNTIKVKGKRYCVRAIWDHTFEMTPKLKTVNLKAKNLECIEDPAIFENHNIEVITHDVFTRKWLKRSGVNVIH